MAAPVKAVAAKIKARSAAASGAARYECAVWI